MCGSWLRIIEIDMFFVVRSNDSFNFPLGLITYIVIVVIVIVTPGTATVTSARYTGMFIHRHFNPPSEGAQECLFTDTLTHRLKVHRNVYSQTL